jgi:uncharacterized protein (TIGR02452 family)
MKEVFKELENRARSKKKPSEYGVDENVYRNIHMHPNQLLLGESCFDAEHFKIVMKQFFESDHAKLKPLRLGVQYGTMIACLKGRYFLKRESGEGKVDEVEAEAEFQVKIVELNKKRIVDMAKATKLYEKCPGVVPEKKVKPAKQKKSKKSSREIDEESLEDVVAEVKASEEVVGVCYVEREDCLAVAVKLKLEKKLNPAVLCMASSNNPGGGYMRGSAAQEENLHRRTSLFHHLEDPFEVNTERKWPYPIPEFGGIYCPNVVVLRDSEAQGYAFLPAPVELGIVCCSAYSNPALESEEEKKKNKQVKEDGLKYDRLSRKIADKTKRKMKTIFEIALANRHDSLVLSAFGCGAYRNPPHHIAELFKEVIESEKYAQKFKEIVFAIIEDHNSEQATQGFGNAAAFENVFI